ncbi:MAG: amidohydrolase family protein, partial [Deltaproteobacteria bacterium]
TFQDDWVAFRSVDMLDWHRLLWANDFPHSDSTWPWSRSMLDEHAARLGPAQRDAILSGNTAELYGIDLDALAAVAPAASAGGAVG